MARSPRTSRTAGDSRWLALIVICAGMLMIVLDATIQARDRPLGDAALPGARVG